MSHRWTQINEFLHNNLLSTCESQAKDTKSWKMSTLERSSLTSQWHKLHDLIDRSLSCMTGKHICPEFTEECGRFYFFSSCLQWMQPLKGTERERHIPEPSGVNSGSSEKYKHNTHSWRQTQRTVWPEPLTQKTQQAHGPKDVQPASLTDTTPSATKSMQRPSDNKPLHSELFFFFHPHW